MCNNVNIKIFNKKIKTISEIQNRKGCLVRLMSFLSLEFSCQGCTFMCQEFVKGILYWVESRENDLYNSFQSHGLSN